jgi:hypothetical protein
MRLLISFSLWGKETKEAGLLVLVKAFSTVK